MEFQWNLPKLIPIIYCHDLLTIVEGLGLILNDRETLRITRLQYYSILKLIHYYIF